MANNWTPETGFHSKALKKHSEGHPKPGLGTENMHRFNSLHHNWCFGNIFKVLASIWA